MSMTRNSNERLIAGMAAHRSDLGLVSLLAVTTFTFLLPIAAAAAPITYAFSSGSAVIRSTLAGESQSLFLGAASVDIDLIDITAVLDTDAGANGRLESLEFVGADFSVDLDTSRVALSTLNVFSPTISSVSGTDLNAFGQFNMLTEASATVTGSFPNGDPFGPAAITSAASTGSASGIVFLSGDEIMIQVIGVTVAEFDQFGSPAPGAPNVELKVDFTFIGQATTPIPEPTAALVFGAGLAVVATRMRRGDRGA